MSLDHLLPIKKSTDISDEENIFNVRFEKETDFPGFRGPGVALITSNSILCELVRLKLIKFKNHFKNITLYDLGTISNDSIETIIETSDFLANKDIVPVFVGLNLEQSIAFAQEKKTKFTLVSNTLDFIKIGLNPIDTNYLAYQRHLCTLSDIYAIEENNYNSLSLGKMRSFPSQLEPILRDVQILNIDLNAMRTSDAPNITNTIPSGLNAEELCQILKYTGSSDHLNSVFFNFQINSLHFEEEANLIAESIWYLFEGRNMKITDHPSKSKDISTFIVHSTELDEDLLFVKHNQSGKWWLEFISEDVSRVYLSCSYEEYQLAINDEVPERLLKFING